MYRIVKKETKNKESEKKDCCGAHGSQNSTTISIIIMRCSKRVINYPNCKLIADLFGENQKWSGRIARSYVKSGLRVDCIALIHIIVLCRIMNEMAI